MTTKKPLTDQNKAVNYIFIGTYKKTSPSSEEFAEGFTNRGHTEHGFNLEIIDYNHMTEEERESLGVGEFEVTIKLYRGLVFDNVLGYMKFDDNFKLKERWGADSDFFLGFDNLTPEMFRCPENAACEPMSVWLDTLRS